MWLFKIHQFALMYVFCTQLPIQDGSGKPWITVEYTPCCNSSLLSGLHGIALIRSSTATPPLECRVYPIT